MALHEVPAFYAYDAMPPVIIAGLYIVACSLIREPARRNFNAIMIGGSWSRLSEWWLRCVGVRVHCDRDVLRVQRTSIVPLHRHRLAAAHRVGRDASFLWAPDRSVRTALISGMCDHRRAHRDLVFRRRAFGL
jgi:hypothetical protein